MRPTPPRNDGTDARDQPGLAIGLLLTAMGLFVTMDAIAKGLAAGELAPEFMVFWRNGLVLLFLIPLIALRWRERPLRTSRPMLQILRGLLLIGAATIFIHALRFLPLETTTAIAFVSPLYVTALSIPFLGERVGPRRWAAVALGFVGVLVILRPWGASFQLAMLLPLFSSLCWASALVITRAMRGVERPFTVLVWSMGSGLIALAPFGLASWTTPTPWQAVLLFATALCHIGGQYLTIRAYMLASASILAPFSYSTIIWATLFGALVFDSLPDGATVAGTAILVAAGVYVWHRERRQTA